MTRRALPLCLVIVLGLSATLPSHAQERIPSNCLALSQAAPSVVPVRYGGAIAPDSVRIRYLNHASYAIETEGLLAITDYTGRTGNTEYVPNVVTMNNAHGTHFTSAPDPRIPLVLPGWPQNGVPAAYDLDIGEMLIRNVTTDLRGPFGEGARKDGNSIFIFEVAGMCIGHLGHLHQIPTPEQYAAIGRLDVVMVPVDGGYTMNVSEMANIIRRFNPRIVLPMHWFTAEGLSRFLVQMNDEYEIELAESPEITVSLQTLPRTPTIMVLNPELFP